MAEITYEEMMNSIRMQKFKDILNYDKVVELGINAMWKDLCEQIKTPDIDPTDIFSSEVEQLQNLEYSMKLMNICCLSELWEQELYNFLKEKGLITVYSNDYSRTKQIFENAYPGCEISNYPMIVEMRTLVNAIKHGEGRALTDIRNLTSDSILADSNIGMEDEHGTVTKKKQIEFDNNTLTSKTLNVEGKLQAYSDAVVLFWQDVFQADRTMHSTPSL